MKGVIKFESNGVVLGNYWGGGSGAYPARKFKADSLEEITKLNYDALKDGSLDSGMGYESLKGAVIEVTKIEVIEIDGREFTNREYSELLIGTLTEDERDSLINCSIGLI